MNAAFSLSGPIRAGIGAVFTPARQPADVRRSQLLTAVVLAVLALASIEVFARTLIHSLSRPPMVVVLAVLIASVVVVSALAVRWGRTLANPYW